MNRAFNNSVRKICCIGAAVLLLCIVSCDEIDDVITDPPVSGTNYCSESTSEDSTLMSETSGIASSTIAETTLKPEDVTQPETTLSPDTTQSEVTSAETTSTSQDITIETEGPVETTTPSQDVTTTETPEITTIPAETTVEISETTVEPDETTAPYTEEQLEQINELLDIAYTYDHDVAKNGIGSIHVKWPEAEGYDPFEIIITAKGADYNDPTNLTFKIDKQTALKFISTIDKDLTKSEVSEGLDTSKIYEMRNNGLDGVWFEDSNNEEIINKYLSLFTEFTPEKPFYFEDRKQISDEQMNALNNYLYSVNDSYKNGIYHVAVEKVINKNNPQKYYYLLSFVPSMTNDKGETVPNWEFPRCNAFLSDGDVDKFSHLFNLDNCSKIGNEKIGNIYYAINMVENISDTLRKQILYTVYETLVENKKINDPSLEK